MLDESAAAHSVQSCRHGPPVTQRVCFCIKGTVGGVGWEEKGGSVMIGTFVVAGRRVGVVVAHDVFLASNNKIMTERVPCLATWKRVACMAIGYLMT
eukprot:scaffold4006_cov73-Skeletonema_dohrnii-CCMP3373.AAC.1